MSLHRLMAGLAALFLLIAGGFQLAPLRSLAADTTEPEPLAAMPELNFTALVKRFDLSALPAPVTPEPVLLPPPPPPDPTAGLKRYRYIGLAKSDARAAGVFERDGAVSVIAIGAALDGFTLTALSGDSARFVNSENVEASLRLQTPQTP